MKIRDAIEADAPSIMEIYNDAVINTTAIWNDVTVTVENRVHWMRERQRLGYPVLVAVDDSDRLLGYASFGDFRAFDGYRHTVEHSVYVHQSARQSGIAYALMVALIARARALGKHVMVGAIEAGNAASIALHLKMGFEHCGNMKEVGTKFGRWLDLALLQLKLDDHAPGEGR